MEQEAHRGFQDYLATEWERCSAMVSAFEGHAVTFLTTANGGGVAALMAFAGSAGYTSPWAYATLAAFIVGIFLAGATIAAGYYRLCHITKGLGDDHRKFNMGSISVQEVGANHEARFNKFDWGLSFAWGSAIALLFGMALGTKAYIDFPAFKAEKEKAEAAKASKDPITNLTCAAAAVPQQKKK